MSLDLLGPGDAMPAGIARYLPEASGDFQAALIGLGVVLFVLTLIVNIASRRIVARVDTRLRGAAA